MTKTMAPRFEIGEKFYDAAFYDLYKKLDYPAPWIEEGKNFKMRIERRTLKVFHHTTHQIKGKKIWMSLKVKLM